MLKLFTTVNLLPPITQLAASNSCVSGSSSVKSPTFSINCDIHSPGTEHKLSLSFYALQMIGATVFGHQCKTDKSLKNTAALLFSCSSSFSVSDSYTRQMLSLHVWNSIYFPAFYAAMCQIYLKIMHGSRAEPLQSSVITHSRCARVGFFVPQPTTGLLGAVGRQVSEASIVVEAAAEAKCKHMQVIYRGDKTSSGVIFVVGLPVHYFCKSK